MDVLGDEWTAYINRKTGELITIKDEPHELGIVPQRYDFRDASMAEVAGLARRRTRYLHR